MNPEVLLDWITSCDSYFDWYQLPEARHVCICKVKRNSLHVVDAIEGLVNNRDEKSLPGRDELSEAEISTF